MILKSVFTDMCFQAIGGVDPKFDFYIQTVNYHGGDSVWIEAHNYPELVDYFVGFKTFESRKANLRAFTDTYKFKVDVAWQKILQTLAVDDYITDHDYTWDRVVYFVDGNNNPEASKYAKMIRDTV